MTIPFEADVECLRASAAALLRPQSSSLRDRQHPAGWGRTRLFDSERVAKILVFQRLCGFSVKFVTTLADLRGRLSFRILGCVLISQGGISVAALQGVLALRQVAPFIIDAAIGLKKPGVRSQESE